MQGSGIHSGQQACLEIRPLPPGSGRWFVRKDLPGAPRIPALIDRALPTARRTVLREGDAAVSTPEHLLAALSGVGIQDAELLLEGPEVPALDGSALPFARTLMACSESSPPWTSAREVWRVRRSICQRLGQGLCWITPSQRTEVKAAVELPARHGPEWQRLTFEPGDPAHFMARIAPARTFGFAADAPRLRASGLARGASMRNVLALTPQGRVINPGGTRLMQEPVRHKVLDAMGDLALLGSAPLLARVRLERGSHRLLITALQRAVTAGDIYRIDISN